MLLHFALVLHFVAILITFCVNITFCGVTGYRTTNEVICAKMFVDSDQRI